MFKVSIIDKNNKYNCNFSVDIGGSEITIQSENNKLMILSNDLDLIDCLLLFLFLILGYVPKIEEIYEDGKSIEYFSANKYNTEDLYISNQLLIEDINNFLTKKHLKKFIDYIFWQKKSSDIGYHTLLYTLMYFCSESYSKVLKIHKLTLLAQSFDFVNVKENKFITNLESIFKLSYKKDLLKKLEELVKEFNILELKLFYRIITNTRHGVTHLTKKKDSLLGSSNEKQSIYFFDLCLYTYRIYIFKKLVSNNMNTAFHEKYFLCLLQWYNANKK